MSTVGERIKSRRLELKMTQEELANKLGYKSKTSINKIELGVQDPPQKKIAEFARALETDPAVLMGWQEHIEEFLEREKNDVQEYEKAKWFVATDETIKKIVMAYSRADEITQKHVRLLLGIENANV